MPYPANLSSANDESDAESFSDALSPADGFFRPNRISPNSMVPDPSLQAEDKVLIATNEGRADSGRAFRSMNSPTLGQLFPSQNYASSSRSNNHPSPSSTSYTPSSPLPSRIPTRRTVDDSSEHTPLIQGPPPAYTSSPPTTSTLSHTTRGYSTLEPHRIEQDFPPNHEPESMGSPSEVPVERVPPSNNPTRGTSRQRIRKLLFFALMVSVMTGVLTSLKSVCMELSSIISHTFIERYMEIFHGLFCVPSRAPLLKPPTNLLPSRFPALIRDSQIGRPQREIRRMEKRPQGVICRMKRSAPLSTSLNIPMAPTALMQPSLPVKPTII